MKNRIYSAITILVITSLMVSGAGLAKGGKGDREGFSGPPSATAKWVFPTPG